ncbi:MAG: T9SS type A sorting domain-containing protein [Bacteroidia bacterium]
MLIFPKKIFSLIVFGLFLVIHAALVGQVHMVTIGTNAGPGSLRAAIDSANARPGPDTITFSLAGPPPFVINTTTQLPDIIDSLTVIDATTQPGYVFGNVILDGITATGYYHALEVMELASGFELYGLYVRNFHHANLSGSGIFVKATGAIIGKPGKGNIFTGNRHGILIGAHRSRGLAIQSNYVGIEPDGITVHSNARNGIYLAPYSGSTDGTFIIGGNRLLGEGNLVGGNGWSNLGINAKAIVQGNDIGTNASQTLNWGNGWNIIPGFNLNNVSIRRYTENSLIGGDSPEFGNVIGYGRSSGILVQTTKNVTIKSNIIFRNGQSGDAGINMFTTDSILITNNSFYCNSSGIRFSSANQNKAAPIITTALSTSIIGSASPGDSIEVFAVDTSGCSILACQGRTFLGGTVANASGAWTINGSFTFDIVTAIASNSSANRSSRFATCRPLDYILEQKTQPESPLAAKQTGFQLFPNPAKDAVSFILPHAEKSAVWRLSIFASDGKVVLSKHITTGPDIEKYSLPLEDFMPGIYRVKLQHNNQRYAQTLLIIR